MLGMVIFNYTTYIFLPLMEGNIMVNWQDAGLDPPAAAVFEVGFSYIAFPTFGDDTQEVITATTCRTRRSRLSSTSVWSPRSYPLLSYPLPYFAAVELFQAVMFRGRPELLRPVIRSVSTLVGRVTESSCCRSHGTNGSLYPTLHASRPSRQPYRERAVACLTMIVNNHRCPSSDIGTISPTISI